MIMRLRFIMSLLVLICLGWMGWKSYTYFFDTDLPALTIAGLERDVCYSGDIQCTISSDKCCKFSIWLDGQLLANNEEVCRINQEYPFTIPTKAITNGKHMLMVSAVDTTYQHNKATYEYEFTVDNIPLQAAFVKPESDYKVFQGRTLHVQFQVNKEIKNAKVHALAKTWNCFPEFPGSLVYECFIPIACEEQPNEYLFSIELADNVGNTLSLDNKFQIVLFPFKRQTLQFDKSKLKEEEELGVTENIEKALEKITYSSPSEKMWRGSFCTPIDIERITCDFGTVRTTQEKGRYIHRALDVINMPKSVVWAPQDGVVALKERYSSSGNTVVIDHGCGILSLFFHLDNFANIEVGQKISQGNPIGTIGKTGYATGYHLHWEQRVQNIAVDPIQWTKATF